MSDHTPEPWRVNHNSFRNCYVEPAQGGFQIAHVKAVPGAQSSHDPLRDANARRIVACVNACAGVETELLEQHGFGESGEHARMHKAQDSLITALASFLEGLLPAPADHFPTGVIESLTGKAWVQCSDDEHGHAFDDCPNDLVDSAEVYTTAAEVRAMLTRVRSEAVRR